MKAKTSSMATIAYREKDYPAGLIKDFKEESFFEPLPVDILTVDIVLPAYNEEKDLSLSVNRLNEYLSDNFPYRYRIIIADNGSSDRTMEIAKNLEKSIPTVKVVHIEQKGRGRALKRVWQESDADILTYMDIDLSTDLDSLFPLIEPLIKGEAPISTGSRLQKASRTKRCLKREFISRSYNSLIKWSMGSKFSDAQCGFKAIRKDAANLILRDIKDNEWFFDTELLIKAESRGWAIHEVPVIWEEDQNTSVKIVKTAVDDIKGLNRVRSELNNKIAIEKLSLLALLFGTLLLYLYGISQNGYANSYYTAAVQAASASWKAFLFGSLDAANHVTVDKPPVSIWFMAISARIFGFSSFNMLFPNALAGVSTVWLTYAAVRRIFDAKSAIIAGTVTALTPVAALMFCFNSPDAILTMFLAASGYAFIRSLEGEKPLLWLAITALMTGFAFNAKMLQGLILLPIMLCIYSCFAKPKLLTRVGHMFYAGVITTISTLWWSLIVWLTPSSARPYIGSSTQNSIWDLILGYNGLGRLLGNMGGGPGGGALPGGGFMPGAGGGMLQALGDGGPGPGGNGFGGQTGLLRIFNSDFGPNIGWLIPFSVISALLIAWLLRKMPRDDKQRAAVLFWGGWVILHVAVFSITSGVIHPYYPIVMAPAIGALVGVGIPYLWESYKKHVNLLWVLPLTVLATTITSSSILGYGNYWPWLTWGVLIGGIFAGSMLLVNQTNPSKLLQKAGLVLAAVACAAGPLAFTLSTVASAHSGSIPTAGPEATAMQQTNNNSAIAETALIEYLQKNRNGAKWLVAVASAHESAPIQISSGQPVMAIGGFMNDKTLTLDQFKTLIKEGKIRYYATSSRGPGGFGNGGDGGGLFGGPGGGPGRPGGNSEIESWVTSNGTVVDYGGSSVTLYELKPAN